MKFEMMDPFEIDNGELTNLSPELCFALGVEWCIFRSELLETRDTLCKRHNRIATVEAMLNGFAKVTIEPEPILRVVK